MLPERQRCEDRDQRDDVDTERSASQARDEIGRHHGRNERRGRFPYLLSQGDLARSLRYDACSQAE